MVKFLFWNIRSSENVDIISALCDEHEIDILAIAELSLSPGDSWYVGDDPVADVCGAKNAGLNAAWIERYIPWPKGVAPCFDAKIDSIYEISIVARN